MVYDAPVLLEVGAAADLVLGWAIGHQDGASTGMSLIPSFAVGLDE